MIIPYNSTVIPDMQRKNILWSQAPRSGRAKDVVRYLWEEAQWDPVPWLVSCTALVAKMMGKKGV